MKIKSCSFVNLSQILTNDDVYHAFCECCTFTWGDTQHTLVKREDLLDEIHNLEVYEATAEQKAKDAQAALAEVIGCLETLPDGVLIDLES
jgi:hypothetical protein